MLQMQSILRVIDNSGGKFVKFIKVLKKGHSSRFGFVGDLLVVSVRQLRSKNRFLSRVKKGDLVRALLVKTIFPLNRPFGVRIKFSKNAVVLLNKSLKPIGTRVFGSVPKEIRTEKFSKIILLSKGLI